MVIVKCESCGKELKLADLIKANYTIEDIVNWEEECYDMDKGEHQ